MYVRLPIWGVRPNVRFERTKKQSERSDDCFFGASDFSNVALDFQHGALGFHMVLPAERKRGQWYATAERSEACPAKRDPNPPASGTPTPVPVNLSPQAKVTGRPGPEAPGGELLGFG